MKYWAATQQQWYNQKATTVKVPTWQTGLWWSQKLIAHCVHYSLSRWQERNNALHATIASREYDINRAQLIAEIDFVFDRGKQSRTPDVRRLFRRQKSDVIQRDNSYLQRWLDSAKEALQWEAATGQSRITDFLP
jgi:hypothetical protein